jgi:hypothetical protein
VDDPDLENGSCKTESALEQIPIPCGARITLFQSKSSWTPAVATPLISLGVASQLSSPAKAGDDAFFRARRWPNWIDYSITVVDTQGSGGGGSGGGPQIVP